MNAFEKIAKKIRHSKILHKTDWLWNLIRPLYNNFLSVTFYNGISRKINGTDEIRVSARFSNTPESYEPDVWAHIMSNIHPNDFVVDVGASIGLYAIAIGKKISSNGRVVAFEPNYITFKGLQGNVSLNKLKHCVQVFPYACGEKSGKSLFACKGSESQVLSTSSDALPSTTVKIVALSEFFKTEKIDVLKIDVEGYEEFVLRGAAQILSDNFRKPRLIYIEVHPYAWDALKVTGNSLLQLLKNYNYRVLDLKNVPVHKITEYGEIVAAKID